MTQQKLSPEIPGAYHEGSRQLQDQFDSRRIADRLEQVNARAAFSEHDRAFIEAAPMFFLATADPEGWPDCSYKGGMPGFVRVTDEHSFAFPDYDGNGMFRSLGNISVNPQVGLLFLNFEKPSRLRVNGIATLHTDDPLLSEFSGAVDRPGACRADLPELSPLHPYHADGEILRVRAQAGSRPARAGLEGTG